MTDMDDLPLDTEGIQKYMLSVPHLHTSTPQQATITTATSGGTSMDTTCTIIPIQAFPTSAVTLDTTQAIMVPTMAGPGQQVMLTQAPVTLSQSVSPPQVSPSILKVVAQSPSPQASKQSPKLSPKSKDTQAKSQGQSVGVADAVRDAQVISSDDELDRSGGSTGSNGRSDAARHNSLQAVISHLISTQTAAMMKDGESQEEADAATKAIQGGPTGVHSPEQPRAAAPSSVSPTIPSQRSPQSMMVKGRSRLSSRGDANSNSSSPTGIARGSTGQKSRASREGPNRIPANGNNVVFNSNPNPVGFDKFGAIYYDYNLPDRGLGGGAVVPTRPAPPQSAVVAGPVAPPNVVNMGAGLWHYPQSPVQLSVTSPNTSERSGPSPLDLSSAHPREMPKLKQEPKEVDKADSLLSGDVTPIPPQLQKQPLTLFSDGSRQTSTPHTGSRQTPTPTLHTGGKTPPEKQPLLLGQPVTSTSPQSLSDKQHVKSGSSKSLSEKQQVKQKVLYKQNMLIFGQKEVEIISVGNNRWIVRNETELSTVVNKGNDKTISSPLVLTGGQPVTNYTYLSTLTNTDHQLANIQDVVMAAATMAPSSQTSVLGLQNTSPNKRQQDSDSGCHESETQKIPKLSNGDVHKQVSGATMASVSFPASVGVVSLPLVNGGQPKLPMVSISQNSTVIQSESINSSNQQDSVRDFEDKGFPVLQQMLNPSGSS